VLKIENMDDPDYAQGQAETQRTAEEEKKPEPKDEDMEGDMEDGAEDEELDEDGNPIPKKVVEKVVVKKDMSGRISSEFDQMIEIQGWKETIIQISAFVMAVSNYNESFVNITIIDLKMRRQNLVKTFNTSRKPTKLYQIDENNLLVGTEGGKIEHWVFNESACRKIYDAHPESDAGISAILELKTTSSLLRGANAPDNFKLIATASAGDGHFRLWKLELSSGNLIPYIKI
jgi:hypothetical protein